MRYDKSRGTLKFVPAGINLLLPFLSFVVQPVLFVQEQLAAVPALCGVALVNVPCVDDQIVVTRKLLVAIVAFVFLPVQKPYAHG
jgi:hypothetical protein